MRGRDRCWSWLGAGLVDDTFEHHAGFKNSDAFTVEINFEDAFVLLDFGGESVEWLSTINEHFV